MDPLLMLKIFLTVLFVIFAALLIYLAWQNHSLNRERKWQLTRLTCEHLTFGGSIEECRYPPRTVKLYSETPAACDKKFCPKM